MRFSRWSAGGIAATFLLTAAAATLPSCARAQTKKPKHGKGAAKPVSMAGLPSASERALKVCVAADAPAEVKAAAQAILAASRTQPLLRVFSGSKPPPTELTDSAALMAEKPEARAYDHLVLVGLMTDPLIKAAWQREARTTVPDSLYAFGFGYLSGDIGYIESDRNPFLHGVAIKVAPYETEVVTITGTTPAGVALAARAFLKEGLINGLVAASGWQRPNPNLLSRDPLAPDFALPAFLPPTAAGLPLIGVTQAAEDEYRGVLADTGTEPVEIWRAKYHPADAWDGAGADAALANYATGLQRRAYEDTLWCARFASASAAAAAAPKVAHAANLRTDSGGAWHGAQPGYGTGSADAETHPMTLWQRGPWLFMSTLPTPPTTDLLQATQSAQ